MGMALAVVYGRCSGKQHWLLLRARLVSSSAAGLVCGEVLHTSSLKSLLFYENC